jgi:nitroreductase
MELVSVVRRRRMVRSYDPQRPIDPKLLSELLSLAVRAPSAGNTQGWHFLALTDITSRDTFWEATATADRDSWQQRMRTAPALVICLSDKTAYLERYAEPDKGWTDRDEHRWPVPYWHIDTGMAAMILLLAATDAGLGACFFGVPGDRWPELRTAFGIPERLDPIGVVSLGYPAAQPGSTPSKPGRRSMQSVLSYGRYGTSGP